MSLHILPTILILRRVRDTLLGELLDLHELNPFSQIPMVNSHLEYARGLSLVYTTDISKPYCSKCSLHHDGSCPCTKCKRFGHVAKDCKTVTTGTNTSAPKTCYECKGTGHFRKDCPQLKNKNTAKGRFFVLNTEGNQRNPRLIDLLNTGSFTY